MIIAPRAITLSLTVLLTSALSLASSEESAEVRHISEDKFVSLSELQSKILSESDYPLPDIIKDQSGDGSECAVYGQSRDDKGEDTGDKNGESLVKGAHNSSTYWIKQLFDNGFRIHDPEVRYPKFPKFCLNVYNWGDKTFNSYDTTYVVGTGKNWKLRGNNSNWGQSYVMDFGHKQRIMMSSKVYSDIGGYISFMAVNVGYAASWGTLFRNVKDSRKHFSFNFTCSRFSANYMHYSTNGGVRIHKLGDLDIGHHISIPFDDINHVTTQFHAYYFFNDKKYSQAAAYAYSKYQLKSAGSWIAGINISSQKIAMDFSKLDPEYLKYLPTDELAFTFHYTDYGLIGGYGYNWVLQPRKWLVNFTIMPSIGLKRSYEDASEGSKNMISNNISAMFSVVFNHRSLFVSLYGNFHGSFNYNSQYFFFNSSESINLNVGMRF